MLELKTKKEQIELRNTLTVDANNVFEIVYKYSLKAGALEDSIEAVATKEGRQVLTKSTHDGQHFQGYLNDTAEDDLTGLDSLVKADLLNIYANPAALIA